MESFCFAQETKAVFISIRYPKTCQTQDVKSESTKRSLRKLGQPKRDSAFEQKTRIVSSREIWGSSQNNFLYLQPKKEAEQRSKRHFWNVLNVILESWCFPFGEIAHNFSEGLYENHQNNCIQYKTTTKTTFPKKSKAVFISIRYRKTSQTQDVKSQSTKRSLRELAQPKRDCAFEQKTRIVPSRDTSGSSQNIFFSYNQRKKQSRAETDIFWTYSTSFWKVGVFLSVRSPIIFRKVCTKIIKTMVSIMVPYIKWKASKTSASGGKIYKLGLCIAYLTTSTS